MWNRRGRTLATAVLCAAVLPGCSDPANSESTAAPDTVIASAPAWPVEAVAPAPVATVPAPSPVDSEPGTAADDIAQLDTSVIDRLLARAPGASTDSEQEPTAARDLAAPETDATEPATGTLPEFQPITETPGKCKSAVAAFGDISGRAWQDIAVAMITYEEGYSAYWQDLGDGMWTIGYGHAVTKAEARDVGEPLSQADAAALLYRDLAQLSYVRAAANWFEQELSPQSFAAMVSYAYNTGPNGFAKYGIPKQGVFEIAQAISHASDSKQPQFPGLLCRRAREVEILLQYEFGNTANGSDNSELGDLVGD